MPSRRHPLLAGALGLLATACSAGENTSPGASTPVSVEASAGTADIADGTASTPTETPAPPTTVSTTPSSTSTSTSTTTSTTSTSTTTTTTTTVPGQVPVVDALAYTVFDMRSGTYLTQGQGDAQLPVGSLMKLLAAQVAFGAGEPTKMVVAPAGLTISDDESTIDINAGQELSRDLLIRAMLKASANDAARMLAIDIAGSEAAFAEIMNTTAAGLGLDNTRAVNATGLDAEGQYSSAVDMTDLGVFLMGNISFQLAVKDATAELNGQAYPNPNDLLGVYPGADGIKTGRTTGAGWCVLASASRDGRRIVVAVLGASTEAARDASATALLDWGFAQP